jgi:hypothetical protein
MNHQVPVARVQPSTSAPAELGHFSTAEAHLARFHDKILKAIVRLNAIADDAFGAVPIGLEGKTMHGPIAGTCGKMLEQISALETALPALETAIERFATLA